jgi:hypothetical protein
MSLRAGDAAPLFTVRDLLGRTIALRDEEPRCYSVCCTTRPWDPRHSTVSPGCFMSIAPARRPVGCNDLFVD